MAVAHSSLTGLPVGLFFLAYKRKRGVKPRLGRAYSSLLYNKFTHLLGQVPYSNAYLSTISANSNQYYTLVYSLELYRTLDEYSFIFSSTWSDHHRLPFNYYRR